MPFGSFEFSQHLQLAHCLKAAPCKPLATARTATHTGMEQLHQCPASYLPHVRTNIIGTPLSTTASINLQAGGLGSAH
jgi:hypothetical protein